MSIRLYVITNILFQSVITLFICILKATVMLSTPSLRTQVLFMTALFCFQWQNIINIFIIVHKNIKNFKYGKKSYSKLT